MTSESGSLMSGRSQTKSRTLHDRQSGSAVSSRDIDHSKDRHEHRPHHRQLLRLRPRDRPPLPRAGLERHRHHAHARARTSCPGPSGCACSRSTSPSPESIAAALEASGPIDVLVNNAGIGAIGAFEATPIATARELFETNTFGVMAMTQAVLPQFRERAVGRRGQRDLERDAGADAAGRRLHREQDRHRGFTASLALELEDFGVRVKLVEPGYGPARASRSNGQSRMEG